MEADTEDPPESAPHSFNISLSGMEEEPARAFGQVLNLYIRSISRYIDLTGLDGVTVAVDYAGALAQLDRGYETSYVLTPTSEHGVGVAMTPAVMRDGEIKSHIVFDALYVWPLENQESDHWAQAFHLVAHECSHVEVTRATDRAFPGMLLRQRYNDMLEAFRWQIIDACWDEYAASRISAPFGADSLESYQATFVLALSEARIRADERIREYRVHGDHERVLVEVSGQYGNLMKFASYLLGHLHGRGYERSVASVAMTALAEHWFASYFNRLENALQDLWSRFGQWQLRAEFAPIGDIAEDIIAEGGVTVTRLGDGQLHINVPFNPSTMPAFNPFWGLPGR